MKRGPESVIMHKMNSAITLVLLAGSALAQKPATPVAIVNGEAIPRSEFDAALNQRPPVTTPLPADQKKLLEQEVLAALVDETLFKQFLGQNVPPIAKAKIDKQMTAFEAALARRKRTLADYCKETRQNAEQIRANVMQMLQWNAYSAGKISDADVRQYYQDNKAHFDRASVRVSHIVIRLPAAAASAEREAAKSKLTDLRQEITAGRITFAEAAAKYSQCPSATRAGDLGFISRKWMVDEPVAKAAFALDVGVVSDVVVSDVGCHLLQVTEKRPGQPSNFADPRVQEEARDCVLEEMRQRLLAELRAKGKVEIKLQ
jgi:parvulin-like peptidyl-prolyl isomerase